MWRAIDDRSTGERKFSKRKCVAAKSKSGKDIMNYFRSNDAEFDSISRRLSLLYANKPIKNSMRHAVILCELSKLLLN